MAFIPAAFLAIGGAISDVAFTIGTAVGLGAVASTAVGASIGGFVAALGGAAGLGAALSAWGNVAAVASLVHTTPKIGAGGSAVDFKADENAGFPYLVGRTATAGNIVFAQTSPEKNNRWLHYFVCLNAVPAESIDSFSANQNVTTFAAGPGYLASNAPYSGVMWLANTVGTYPATPLPLPTGTGHIPEWTSAHVASGMAFSRWILGYTADIYPTGTPKPQWVGHWAKAYDPRLDSTYPGGSGSHRWNDEATWTWSENPFVHALTWCIGRRTNPQTDAGVLILGLGAPLGRIDVDAFIEGMNTADANGWKVGGGVSSKDSKWEVLKAYLQAGGGIPIKLAGKISCVVSKPRVSLATLTEADLVGAVTRAREVSRRDKVNQIVPGYRSEAHNWEMVTASPVKVAGYISAEGLRSQGVGYPMVQDVTQASQLAAYGIYDSHEVAPISLPLRPRWMGLKPGDVFTADMPTLGLSDQDLLVLDRKQNPQTLDYTVICRFETESKHDDALGLTGEVPFVPDPPVFDPLTIDPPGADAWNVSAGSYAGTDGVVFPRLVIGGAQDNDRAAFVIFDYEAGALSGDDFTGSGLINTLNAVEAKTTTLVEIRGVTSGTAYRVAASYVDGRGVVSGRTVLGVVTASTVTIPSGGVTPPTGTVVYESNSPGPWSYTAVVDGTYVVEGWGGGGLGGHSYEIVTDKGSVTQPGTGGGGGAKFQKAVPLSAGDTIGGSVAAGSSVATDGGETTMTSPSCTAGGGLGGDPLSLGFGGVASGGDVNTDGASGAGANLWDGGSAAGGGGDQTTPTSPGTLPGGGGSANSGPGRNGRIRITLTA